MPKPADEPLATAILSLVVFAACIVPFLPPLVDSTVESVPFIALLGLCMAISFVIHLVFLAIAARQGHRSPALWVTLAIVFFPIGSIVGLVLLTRERRRGAYVLPGTVA